MGGSSVSSVSKAPALRTSSGVMKHGGLDGREAREDRGWVVSGRGWPALTTQVRGSLWKDSKGSTPLAVSGEALWRFQEKI